MRQKPVVKLRSTRSRTSSGMHLVGAYAMVAVLVAAVAVGLRGAFPWAHPRPIWSLSPGTAAAVSIGLGLVGAAMVIVFTRVAVRHFGWARTLADRLRPVAFSLSTPHILALALASSLAEELLFRAVLVPWLGVFASSLAFGLVHQMRGPARWAWVIFSFVVGLGLAGLYAATGSLLGPIAAHAVINAANLAWLRSGGRGDGALRAATQRLSPT